MHNSNVEISTDILFRVFNLFISPSLVQISTKHVEEMKTKVLLYVVEPIEHERTAIATLLVTYSDLVKDLTEIGSEKLLTDNIKESLFSKKKHVSIHEEELLKLQSNGTDLPIVFMDKEEKAISSPTPNPPSVGEEKNFPNTGDFRICLVILPSNPCFPKSLTLFKCNGIALLDSADHILSGYPLLLGNFAESSTTKASEQSRFMALFSSICKSETLLSNLESKKADELISIVFYSHNFDLIAVDSESMRTMCRRFLVSKSAYGEFEKVFKINKNIIPCFIGDYRGYNLFLVSYTKEDTYIFQYEKHTL